MARPKSEEKEAALLLAATQVVSVEGAAARTASVARLAGVAEGTLFRYFPTKDALLNALYLHLKRDLDDAMRGGYVHDGNLEVRSRSLWDGYVDWGIAHPTRARALQQLALAECLTDETRAQASRFFPEVSEVARASAELPALRGLPREYTDTLFLGLADATVQSAIAIPGHAAALKATGFRVFWGGLNS